MAEDGKLRIPAGFLKAGQTFHITAHGAILKSASDSTGNNLLRDWMTEAAEDIAQGEERSEPDHIRVLIAKHSPFKDGIAYMPVPRCEMCAHWLVKPHVRPEGLCQRINLDLGKAHGDLAWVAFSNVNRAGLITSPDFGCVQWEEKP